MTLALVVSIGAALLLQPVLSSRLLRAEPRPPRGVFRVFKAGFDALHHVYHGALVRTLRHPLPMLLLLVLALGGALWWGSGLDRSFMPERSLGDLRLELEYPPGTPVEETEARTALLGAWIDEQDGVRSVFSQVGTTERTLAAMQDYAAPNTARVRIILDQTRGAYARGRRLQNVISRKLTEMADLNFTFREEGIGLGEILKTGGAEFSMGVLAENPLEAIAAADRIAVELRRIDGLHDLSVDRVLGTPNVVVHLDREEIVRRGLDPARIARELRARIAGVEATFFNEVDQRIDIAVRFAHDERIDLAAAMMSPIRVGNGESVPLQTFLDFELERPVRELVRRNQRRMVSLEGDVRGRSIDAVWRDAEAPSRRPGSIRGFVSSRVASDARCNAASVTWRWRCCWPRSWST